MKSPRGKVTLIVDEKDPVTVCRVQDGWRGEKRMEGTGGDGKHRRV